VKLIGLLDSPYVRRVALSLDLMGVRFTHQALSVFSDFDALRAINPVVKAPTLITEDGTVLMESGLILEYAARVAGHRLEPEDMAAYVRAQRLTGLALAACEKTVQIVYEHKMRPAEKLHQPWLERVSGQLRDAWQMIESEIGTPKPWLFGPAPMQADITIAVACRFTHDMLPGFLDAHDIPRLTAFSAHAESTAPFTTWRHG